MNGLLFLGLAVAAAACILQLCREDRATSLYIEEPPAAAPSPVEAAAEPGHQAEVVRMPLRAPVVPEGYAEVVWLDSYRRDRDAG